jgi:molecular chaperone GrpE (heat shock protein)
MKQLEIDQLRQQLEQKERELQEAKAIIEDFRQSLKRPQPRIISVVKASNSTPISTQPNPVYTNFSSTQSAENDKVITNTESRVLFIYFLPLKKSKLSQNLS